MPRLAQHAGNSRDAGFDDRLLMGLAICQPLNILAEQWPFVGLVHAPELMRVEDTAPPISTVELVEEPTEYLDSYEFELPLEMTGSVPMRLERCELPDIEWDY